jgi:hypothetical protein
MATIIGLPFNFGTLQGIASSYPYLFPYGDDQPQVRIFDSSGQQIIPEAKIMSYDDKPEAQIFQHPMEDGASFMDHRVANPNEVNISLIFEKDFYRSAYSAIRDIYNSGTLVTIQSRTTRETNMALVSLPQEQSAEQYDAVPVHLTFRQMTFVVPAQGTMTPQNTQNPADSNTTQQGQKSGVITSVNLDAQQQYINQAIQGLPRPRG